MSESTLGRGQSFPYWAIDIPGLDESGAESLLGKARAAGIGSGSVVDPREFLTVHLPESAVVTLLQWLDPATRPDDVGMDYLIRPFIESLSEDLKEMRELRRRKPPEGDTLLSAIGGRRRLDALVDLVELRVPLSEAVAAVRGLSWDSDVELVLLSRANAAGLLTRYLRGALDSDDLEIWANAVEGREDLGLASGDEELLGQFVFETANPTLNEGISEIYARRWLERFSEGL